MIMLGLLAGCASTPAGLRDGEVIDVDGLRYRIERFPRDGVPLAEVAPGWLSHPQRGLLALHGETVDAYFVRILETAATSPAAPGAELPAHAEAGRASGTASAITALRPRGRFLEVDTALPREGEWRERFALAATGSGGVQLVATPARKTLTRPLVWVHEAGGRWARRAEDFPAQPYDYGTVALGDFDADGRIDLALGMHLLGFATLLAAPEGRWRDASSGLPHSRRDGDITGSGIGLATLADPEGDRLLLLPEVDGRGSRLGAELGLAEFRWRDGRWISTSLARGLSGSALQLSQLPGCAPLLAVKANSNNTIPLLRREGEAWTAEAAPAGPTILWTASTLRVGQFDGAGCADLLLARKQRDGSGWRSTLALWVDQAPGWQALAMPLLPADLDISELWAEQRAGELQILVGSAAGDLLHLRGRPGDLRWIGHLPAPAWRRGCRVAQIEALPGHADRWVVAFAGDGDRFDPQRCRSNGGLVEVRWETTAAH
jgi:hypothetical protein